MSFSMTGQQVKVKINTKRGKSKLGKQISHILKGTTYNLKVVLKQINNTI